MARKTTGFRIGVSAVVDNNPMNNMGSDFGFTITFPDNQSVTEMGVNGVYVKFNSDTTAEITLSLLPNSDGNDILNTLYVSQRTRDGKLFPVTLTEETGVQYQCDGCSIKQVAEITTGDAEVTNRPWILGVSVYTPPTGSAAEDT